MLGSIPIKQIGKQEREKQVLLGLVDYYIRTGKPVGSNTLKDAEFENLSSATIRNYFANLEENGFLHQPHSSGGRIPTNLAYKTYAHHFLDCQEKPIEPNPFAKLGDLETREIALLLQESADLLSEVSQCAVLMSAPRFDQDFVVDIKLLQLDANRCLTVLITDFGMIQTEVVRLPTRLSLFSIKRIETYFQERLRGSEKSESLTSEEEAVGHFLYNESMVRYIVGYSNFIDEDIYRTGFSRLLRYSDFKDAAALAGALSLFENYPTMRLLLRECKTQDRLKVWIGSDLPFYSEEANSSVIAVPYMINNKAVGSVAVLGPTRLPYRTLFTTLNLFSEEVSRILTRNVYKFKISFRQPDAGQVYLQKEETEESRSKLILLEDKRKTD